MMKLKTKKTKENRNLKFSEKINSGLKHVHESLKIYQKMISIRVSTGSRDEKKVSFNLSIEFRTLIGIKCK